MRGVVSSRLAGFGTTIFAEMTRLSNEHGAINLAQGFPDFDGPEFVKDAAVAAIRAGHAQYARVTGIPALAQAVARKYVRDYDLAFDPESEITITSGATEAIFDALNGICDAGDEVVLFEPYYDSYRACVSMAGAVPRYVTLRLPDWSFDAAQLSAAFSPRTRAVVVNSPHNPTGKVFSEQELSAIAQQCRRHNVLCITDEVYEHLVFEGRHIPMASLPGMRERTITISSLGKTFSLTGWKVGWAAAPAPLSAAVRAAHQFVTFATATPLQHGAAAALATGPEYYAQFLASYRGKREFLSSELARLGFDVYRPAGTYFVCAGFSRFGFDDDAAFCRHLIESVGVAAIPPSAFYEVSGEGKQYVRFAFCKKDDTLSEAVRRLGKLCA